MDPAKEDLLMKLFAGDLSPQDPRVSAAFEDEQFARTFKELQGARDALDEESVLGEARSAGTTRAKDRIQALVSDHLTPRRRRSLFRASHLIASLAAAALVVAFLWWRGNEPAEKQVYLGPNQLQCTAPSGAEADFSVFRWAHDAEDGFYVFEVYDMEGALLEGGRSPELAGFREWSPELSSRLGWPDKIAWRVRWVGPGSSQSVVGQATATRADA